MKTNLDGIFKTNHNYEIGGVEFVVRQADEKKGIKELSFRVRHFNAGNPKMKAAMASYYKPYARQIEMGTLDQRKSDEISIRIFVDACLVDWKGVEVDGQEVPCSKDVAVNLFMELPALFDSLMKYASDFNNYKEDLGNS